MVVALTTEELEAVRQALKWLTSPYFDDAPTDPGASALVKVEKALGIEPKRRGRG